MMHTMLKIIFGAAMGAILWLTYADSRVFSSRETDIYDNQWNKLILKNGRNKIN